MFVSFSVRMPTGTTHQRKSLVVLVPFFHCILPNNLAAQCTAINVKHHVPSPWISRWVPDNNRKVQLSMAAFILAWMQQGNLASRFWGELTHPSPRMLYSCSFLMTSKWKMQHLVCPRQIFLGSSQAVLGPPSPVFPPAFPWLYKLLFLIQTL